MVRGGWSGDSLEVALEAKRRYGGQLLSHPDVHGVGVGRRRRRGEKTDEYAVVVHLRWKLPLDEVAPSRRLPRELRLTDEDGNEISAVLDVQQHPEPLPESARLRPVPGGAGVGLSGAHLASGTLGGWVWDTITRRVVALSNEHVFGSVPGVGVIQPAAGDGGVSPHDHVASVLRAGTLDAAIAAPDDAGLISTTISGGALAVFEIGDAAIDMRVEKTGRATGRTVGIVDLIDFDYDYYGSHADLWVDSEDGDFSSSGDSGALYVEASPTSRGHASARVVGLHWGGSGTSGVGHPIRRVFDDLGLAPLDGRSSVAAVHSEP
jgi:hypothetical protein